MSILRVSTPVLTVAGTALLLGVAAHAQQPAFIGSHWPGKGIYGKGAIHTERTPPYTVYAQKRDKPGAIEIHGDDTDIIIIMEGAATIVTGGIPVGKRQLRPNEWTADDAQNAVTTRASRGDVFIVPKGTIHWFKEVSGSVGYYAVKVHEPDAPAFDTPGARIWTRAQAFAGKSPLVLDGKQTHRYQLFAVTREKAGIPEVHEKETDLVFVLAGTGTWSVGGTLSADKQTLTGGTSWNMTADDAALVPPTIQHWFSQAQQLAYYAVKVY
ncbi:MAG: cupin domain-containing protein [Vicinamibacterales bacterium]